MEYLRDPSSIHRCFNYINDMPDVLASSIELFADDTKILRKIDDVENVDILQSDLDHLNKWSNVWLLKFNVEKCKPLSVCNKFNSAYYLKDDATKNKI